MFLLVMELSRLAHPALFWTNIVLDRSTRCWAIYSPIDFFWHPGTSFYRIVTSSTVEFSTGIYGIYGQLALTLIAAFLLLAGVAQWLRCAERHDQGGAAARGARARLVPQTAVIGSSAVGTDQRQLGSANAAVVGTITIPLMKRYGVPATFAAAVETAASMGGLIDAAADGRRRLPDGGVSRRALLGRGDARLRRSPSSTTSRSRSRCICCACGCCRAAKIEQPTGVALRPGQAPASSSCRCSYLIYLMGIGGTGELLARSTTAGFMLALLVPAFLYFKHVPKEPTLKRETLLGCLRRGIETHGEMTSYLTLLLGDARHHDRPVHRHRLHQPDGRVRCSISAPGTSSR